MSDLFAAFGIDWRLLVINLVNFGLMLGLLWYFLYEPVLKALEARREKIATGVRDADAATLALKEIESARLSKLSAAGKEADQILSHAQSAAVQKERDILAHAERVAALKIAEAEAGAQEAKQRAIKESKEEVAKLIVLGMEKALAQSK
jgi:F-type H+-transporting ATPase subunit b